MPELFSNPLLKGIDTVLFDLDGTLLPTEQKPFVKRYFGLLSQSLTEKGFDADKAIKAIMKGLSAMTANDGAVTNSTLFEDVVRTVYGNTAESFISALLDFYATDFDKAKDVADVAKIKANRVAERIGALRDRGIKTVLATNPVFPRIALDVRLSWIGLTDRDFEHITDYENSSFCKPDTGYYREILSTGGKEPQNCIMIGNNVCEDMAAAGLGIKCFLVTDFLENPDGSDIEGYTHRSVDEMFGILEQGAGCVK